MFLFFLGVILGVGLTLAYRSVAKTIQLQRLRKAQKLNEYIEAEVQRRSYNKDMFTDLPKPPPFKANGARPTHPSHSVPSNW